MMHKLDKELPDILKHYGVKGMKWDESKKKEVAEEVIRGEHGNGEERKEKLGEHYQEVQDIVNEQLLGIKPKTKAKKSDVKKVKKKLKQTKRATTFLERLKAKTKSEKKKLISRLFS